MVNEGSKGEGGSYTIYKDQSIIMHMSDIFHDTHYFMELINTSENKKITTDCPVGPFFPSVCLKSLELFGP